MTNSKTLKKILILDDDADLRKLLIVYLGKMFPEVELAEYDPLALGIPGQDFDWSEYDVLILDYYLSVVGLTGLDILQANRKNSDFPAVIMLTGAGNEEIAVRALKAGVYDYLRKQKLGKLALQNAILNAFEKHQVDKQRISELTQQGHAFNKAIFYQQLEYKRGDAEYRQRLFILVELDDHIQIEEHAGIILRDNIVRHIAKQCYETLKLKNYNPGITRLGDHYIGLLIDVTESPDSIESRLLLLTSHLNKRPYKFGNTEFPFTVSIGAVLLTGEGESADTIIRYAKRACKVAGLEKNNSFYIYKTDEETERLTTPGTSAQKSPASAQKGSSSAAGRSTDAPKTVAPKAETSNPVPVSIKKPAPSDAQSTGNKVVKSTGQPTAAAAIHANNRKDVSGLAANTATPASEGTTAPLKIDTQEPELRKAIEEKRVIRVFQPVISLLNEEIDSDDEIHRVILRQIESDGSVSTGDTVKDKIHTPDFKKFVDRWLLREIIGKLSNSENNHHTFIIDISDASIADASFFNWLRKLLTGLESKTPGKYLALEINMKDLAKLEKQANALITYLRKSHEFKFVLGGVTDASAVIDYASRIKFDLIRCAHSIVKELHDTYPDATTEDPGKSLLDTIKTTGTRFIADDIEDASVLTEAISHGIEYAMGDFIGEPADQLDDVTNIESFEII